MFDIFSNILSVIETLLNFNPEENYSDLISVSNLVNRQQLTRGRLEKTHLGLSQSCIQDHNQLPPPSPSKSALRISFDWLLSLYHMFCLPILVSEWILTPLFYLIHFIIIQFCYCISWAWRIVYKFPCHQFQMYWYLSQSTWSMVNPKVWMVKPIRSCQQNLHLSADIAG